MKAADFHAMLVRLGMAALDRTTASTPVARERFEEELREQMGPAAHQFTTECRFAEQAKAELDRALAAFGARDYLVWVVEHSPETSPGEVKVQIFRLLDIGGSNDAVFVRSKTQSDGDVLAALTFIRDRWLPEVRW